MSQSICLLLLGAIIGGAITYLTARGPHSLPSVAAASPHKEAIAQPALKYPLDVSLYRFTLNKANITIYRQWVQWHHDAYQPMIGTLDRERMYFESVFRDMANEPGVIYWLAINGEGGATSSSSASDIDKKHVEYMKQILIKGSRVTLKTEFTLLPSFIEESIEQHQQAEK